MFNEVINAGYYVNLILRHFLQALTGEEESDSYLKQDNVTAHAAVLWYGHSYRSVPSMFYKLTLHLCELRITKPAVRRIQN